MKNIPLLLGTIFGTILLIVGVAYFFSQSPSAETAQEIDPVLLTQDAHNSLGPADAVITVVEFSDFQCPACKAAQPVVEQMKSQYGDAVRFIYYHYPLDSLHANAHLAAQASEAAAQLGKFWQYHDLLFAKQAEWSDIADKRQLLDTFGEYATQLEVDKASFLERIESQEVADRITKDINLGDTVQVRATPTFFVNGRQTTAPQLLAAVESASADSN
ncbi:MAG: hypothetical protein COY81_01070 [Candidatus Pacebacteria bacterium CG_4_10_14_0_8_um_filter_43_12]|nr:MAG: hypothetical protein COU66_01505 [Candidatus Pacebacteria bacterium CG10_big_fil_rev_8_21_14_0_10_44_11]PIY79738.1 MAG: hypothetical protein COY81_01070 [Candidatus Pacebacteria bacterium CG_4_10_14_0_8_um_filter_43_12]